MLNIKDEGRLLQIVKHCNKINKKMNNITTTQFYKDEDLREIVCFNIFQIGELAKGLTSSSQKSITKFRGNKLKE